VTRILTGSVRALPVIFWSLFLSNFQYYIGTDLRVNTIILSGLIVNLLMIDDQFIGFDDDLFRFEDEFHSGLMISFI